MHDQTNNLISSELIKQFKGTKLEENNNIATRDGNGPGRPRAGPGRAGPENPGPRASRAQTGLKFFYLKVLCATENPNFC